MDATSTISAAILTTVLQSLAGREVLPEAAVVSLIQEVNAHNSADYLRQILVDVAEDLQEQSSSRVEEQAKLTKDLESNLPPRTVTERPIRILRAFLVSQPRYRSAKLLTSDSP